jgi:hypothetical protein
MHHSQISWKWWSMMMVTHPRDGVLLLIMLFEPLVPKGAHLLLPCYFWVLWGILAGQGWTFDNLEESTNIHKEVHQVFFHRINEFGACELYPTYVRMPNSIQDLKECSMAYRIAGFPGCIGSKDTTHIPLERVDYIDRQQHLGFKSSATTRTYN